MTGTVHAAVGAGIGAAVKKPLAAFIAGVISHHFLDSMDHKEAPPGLDGAAIVGFLIFLSIRYGVKSSQFWGALGAIAPDFEHVLGELGFLDKHQRYFSTHKKDGAYHGKPTDEITSQIAMAFLGTLLSEILKSEK